jgi:hypothetical protein
MDEMLGIYWSLTMFAKSPRQDGMCGGPRLTTVRLESVNAPLRAGTMEAARLWEAPTKQSRLLRKATNTDMKPTVR